MSDENDTARSVHTVPMFETIVSPRFVLKEKMNVAADCTDNGRRLHWHAAATGDGEGEGPDS